MFYMQESQKNETFHLDPGYIWGRHVQEIESEGIDLGIIKTYVFLRISKCFFMFFMSVFERCFSGVK